MPNTIPLVGICKNCRQANTGYIVEGRFLCELCFRDGGTSYRYYFTTTTSNSTSSQIE